MSRHKVMRTEVRHEDGLDAAGQQFIDTLRANSRMIGIVAGGILVVILGVIAFRATQSGSDSAAATQMALAMKDVKANQLDPAAQKLTDIVARYGGSTAGNRARLILGGVELRRGNAAAAQKQFDDYLSHGGSDFLRAGGLRGRAVALENQSKYAEAAKSWEDLAKEPLGDEEVARTLLDVARTRTLAGDTAGAKGAYDRILKEFPTTRAAAPAKQHQAELAAAPH